MAVIRKDTKESIKQPPHTHTHTHTHTHDVPMKAGSDTSVTYLHTQLQFYMFIEEERVVDDNNYEIRCFFKF